VCSRRKKKVYRCGTSHSAHLSDRFRQRCDGARPACSRCAKSRMGAACVYEVSSNPISILGETAGPMRISPPSQSVGLPDSVPPAHAPTVGPRVSRWMLATSKIRFLPISLPCLERKRLSDCKLGLQPLNLVSNLSVLVAASRLSLTTTSSEC
jgi:hypothetical protein